MHYLHTSCICCCGFSALWSMLKGFCLDCRASTSSNQSLNDSRPSRILPHLNKAPSNWHSLSISCRNNTTKTHVAVDTLSLKKTRGHNGQHDMGSPSRLHQSCVAYCPWPLSFWPTTALSVICARETDLANLCFLQFLFINKGHTWDRDGWISDRRDADQLKGFQIPKWCPHLRAEQTLYWHHRGAAAVFLLIGISW